MASSTEVPSGSCTIETPVGHPSGCPARPASGPPRLRPEPESRRQRPSAGAWADRAVTACWVLSPQVSRPGRLPRRCCRQAVQTLQAAQEVSACAFPFLTRSIDRMEQTRYSSTQIVPAKSPLSNRQRYETAPNRQSGRGKWPERQWEFSVRVGNRERPRIVYHACITNSAVASSSGAVRRTSVMSEYGTRRPGAVERVGVCGEHRGYG